MSQVLTTRRFAATLQGCNHEPFMRLIAWLEEWHALGVQVGVSIFFWIFDPDLDDDEMSIQGIRGFVRNHKMKIYREEEPLYFEPLPWNKIKEADDAYFRDGGVLDKFEDKCIIYSESIWALFWMIYLMLLQLWHALTGRKGE